MLIGNIEQILSNSWWRPIVFHTPSSVTRSQASNVRETKKAAVEGGHRMCYRIVYLHAIKSIYQGLSSVHRRDYVCTVFRSENLMYIVSFHCELHHGGWDFSFVRRLIMAAHFGSELRTYDVNHMIYSSFAVNFNCTSAVSGYFDNICLKEDYSKDCCLVITGCASTD